MAPPRGATSLVVAMVLCAGAGITAHASRRQPQISDDEKTAVELIAKGDDVSLEKLLTAKPELVRAMVSISERLPSLSLLQLVAVRQPPRSIELATLLITRGADVNQVNPFGCSALHYAVEMWREPPQEYQVVASVMDIASGHPSCGRVFWVVGAFGAGDPALVRLLIDRGALVNARTPRGWTPLHGAVMAARTEFVQVLLASGARASLAIAAEKAGTPEDVARRENQPQIAQLLR